MQKTLALKGPGKKGYAVICSPSPRTLINIFFFINRFVWESGYTGREVTPGYFLFYFILNFHHIIAGCNFF